MLPCPRCGAPIEADPVPVVGWVAGCSGDCEESGAGPTPEAAVTEAWVAIADALSEEK